MGFVQPGRCPRLAAEPLLENLVTAETGGQHLQGDRPIECRVIGPPHLAHATAAQQLQQPVAPKRSALHGRLPDSPPVRSARMLTMRR